MGLEYLKITPEIMLKISAYDQEAQGRLVMAMIAYALNGDEPQFDGMEKFIWPVLKLDIDRCAASVEKQTANGSRGGRPPKTQQKHTETQQNPEKPSETQSKPNESLNSNTNTNINTNTKKEEEVCAREESAPTSATVEGIDGSDLSESIRLNAEVDALLATYKLSEAVRGDLLEDIETHGLDKVKRVMQEAARSDNRGGLSIRFIRACLASDGKPKPDKSRGTFQRHNYTASDYKSMEVDLDADTSNVRKGKDGEMMQRYTVNERRKTWGAAVVDFDGG